MRYLTRAEIVAINKQVVTERGQESVLNDPDRLDANVGRPQWFEDLWEAAGALFHAFAATQAFKDGNKGTALAAVDAFLKWNGWELDATDDEVFSLAMQVAEHEIDTVEELAAFFKAHGVQLQLPDLE